MNKIYIKPLIQKILFFAFLIISLNAFAEGKTKEDFERERVEQQAKSAELEMEIYKWVVIFNKAEGTEGAQAELKRLVNTMAEECTGYIQDLQTVAADMSMNLARMMNQQGQINE
ncbi:MAG: hypothetical protein CMF61_04350 [Magnetococcales bacterium]|nr:hypothetical protein [Magnetococcales bacterium]